MGKLYKDKKKDFDGKVYGYLIKRLTSPITDSDAYHMGYVDEYGNEMKPIDGWAYTRLDRLVFDLKSILGSRLDGMRTNYADIDSLALMIGVEDVKGYTKRYTPLLSIIEEAAYIPPGLRGKAGEVDETSNLPMSDRISFALSVATFLLFSAKLDRFPNEYEIDGDVLPAVEATFGIRSLGSMSEFRDYASNAKITDGRGLNDDGYRLLVRAARRIVSQSLCHRSSESTDDMSSNWRSISNA